MNKQDKDFKEWLKKRDWVEAILFVVVIAICISWAIIFN